MKKQLLIFLIALLSTAPLLAQYSPCYEAAVAEGRRLYQAGKYAQAKKYFIEAKSCPEPNMVTIGEWIGLCDAKIAVAKNVAENKERRNYLPLPSIRDVYGGCISLNDLSQVKGVEFISNEPIQGDYPLIMGFTMRYKAKSGVWKECRSNDAYFTEEMKTVLQYANLGDVFIFQAIQIKGRDGKESIARSHGYAFFITETDSTISFTPPFNYKYPEPEPFISNVVNNRASKSALLAAGRIDAKVIGDNPLGVKYDILGYTLYYRTKSGAVRGVIVEDTKFPEELKNAIVMANVGDVFAFCNIQVKSGDGVVRTLRTSYAVEIK